LYAAGVLVIAHGSRNPQWNHLVELVVGNIRSSLPVRVCYLDFVEGKQIEDRVRDLERLGLKRIIVIPLFITMGSTHLNEIQFALGLIQAPAIDKDIQPIKTHAEIVWCPPIEDHDFAYQIISERIMNLSRNPSEEVLLLVGHGSEQPQFYEKWEDLKGRRMQLSIRMLLRGELRL
jgi:sirohydrochlorin cobaltochelatase